MGRDAPLIFGVSSKVSYGNLQLNEKSQNRFLTKNFQSYSRGVQVVVYVGIFLVRI